MSERKRFSRPSINDKSISKMMHAPRSQIQLDQDFDLFGRKRTFATTPINYENMELNQHLFDLWVVLRKIARTVIISSIIIMVIPAFSNGKFQVNPYKPAVLQILNSLIEHSFSSLLLGNNVTIFIGSPLAPIMFYLNVGFFVALLVSLPLTVKYLVSFIRPALSDVEWDILKRLVKLASLFFFIGAIISYYVIMPVTLRILALSGGVIGEGSVLQMYSLESVLNLLLWGTLGGGILYASPVILLVLIDLEIITPDKIVHRKKELLFAVFTIAAIVTPDPTLVSMVILSLPMIFIVEFIISMGYKIELEKLLRV